MPNESQGLFKALFSALLGTVIGLAVGVGIACLFDQPYNKALGSQDSQAMARGATFIGMAFLGACLGFVIGMATATVLNVRSAHKNNSQS